jgi:hypothetical protein
MFKFVRKNKKLIGVVMGVILMIMFLSNLSPQQSSQPNQMLRTVATLDGQKVTARDVAQATQNWQILKSRQFSNSNSQTSEHVPLLRYIFEFDPTLPDQIDQAQRGQNSVPMFYLLVREADRQGIIVSPEEVETFVNSHVDPPGDPGTEDREAVDYAVADALKIRHMMERIVGAVKVSKPYQEYQLARMMQELTVHVVWIKADSYLPHVPEPTPAQIQAQYDQFKDHIAARTNQIPSEFGNAENPLGFGYKTPNRVQLQYIGLNLTDIRRAAIASKSDQDWYVAAFGDFQAHRDDYDGRPIPETKTPQPIGPTTHPSTQPSLTGVQKLDDLKADFALHVPLVLEQLYQEETGKLGADILREIDSKLSSGFGEYRDAVASGAKLTAGPAADYISYKFLQDLADSIHTKYGVDPILGNIQQYKDIDQLAQLEGIGQSALLMGQNQGEPFPSYAIQLFQPWLSDADKNSRLGALALSQWQPSNRVISRQTGNPYVFRISGYQSANVPALDDVKQQVIADWKIGQAFALAQDAAKSLLADANKQGLTKAAAAAKLPAPIVTAPFDPERIVMNRAMAVISMPPSTPLGDPTPLPFSPDSARELAKQAQQLLITPSIDHNRPSLVADLYPDRIVSVIALNTATPNWDEDNKSELLSEVNYDMQMTGFRPLALSLFTPDAVKTRMNYVATEKNSQQ